MKKEVEIKIKIENPEVVIQKFVELGSTFSEPITQKDIIFVDKDYGDFAKFHPGKNILRIREANGKFFFTLKQPQKNELDCIEKEVEISDPVVFREALELMGYKEAVRVVKTRRKCRYKNYEVCIDNVEKLGDFMELEDITEEDAETVQNEMLEFLSGLNIDISKRVTHGYDTLTWLKDHSGETA